MTETTATRLAAAIDKQREKAWHAWRLLRAIQIAPDVDEDAHIARQQAAKKAVDAALTRLEKLCTASGELERRHCLSYPPCGDYASWMPEMSALYPGRPCSWCKRLDAIEALLREET